MRIHFPEKIKMKNFTTEDTKYIIPPLDLTKTKKALNLNNKNNIESNKGNINPEEILYSEKKSFEIEEWQETIKLVGLTTEQIERFFSNKMLNKLTNSLENLLKIIVDRNNKISLIQKENMSLSSELSQLKNEMLNLTKNYIILKQELKDMENKNNNMDKRGGGDLLDTSMVNSFIIFK